jgi:hypothetical protein
MAEMVLRSEHAACGVRLPSRVATSAGRSGRVADPNADRSSFGVHPELIEEEGVWQLLVVQAPLPKATPIDGSLVATISCFSLNRIINSPWFAKQPFDVMSGTAQLQTAFCMRDRERPNSTSIADSLSCQEQAVQLAAAYRAIAREAKNEVSLRTTIPDAQCAPGILTRNSSSCARSETRCPYVVGLGSWAYTEAIDALLQAFRKCLVCSGRGHHQDNAGRNDPGALGGGIYHLE